MVSLDKIYEKSNQPNKDLQEAKANLNVLQKTWNFLGNTLLSIPLSIGKTLKNAGNSLTSLLVDTPVNAGKIVWATAESIGDVFRDVKNVKTWFFGKTWGYISATGRSVWMVAGGAFELGKEVVETIGGQKRVVWNTYKDVAVDYEHMLSIRPVNEYLDKSLVREERMTGKKGRTKGWLSKVFGFGKRS